MHEPRDVGAFTVWLPWTLELLSNTAGLGETANDVLKAPHRLCNVEHQRVVLPLLQAPAQLRAARLQRRAALPRRRPRQHQASAAAAGLLQTEAAAWPCPAATGAQHT